MEITVRGLWTMIHGMGFGGLYLLACSGAIVELWRHYSPAAEATPSAREETFFRVYLIVMALLAWMAVFTGAYIVYPWYRAIPPAGTVGLPNGSGAAALLAAGIGSFALAFFAIVVDRIVWFQKLMVFYKPTGPLSGVTTSAIVVWLVVWAVLDGLWRNKNVPLGRINIAALTLLFLSVLLTFPPLADLF